MVKNLSFENKNSLDTIINSDIDPFVKISNILHRQYNINDCSVPSAYYDKIVSFIDKKNAGQVMYSLLHNYHNLPLMKYCLTFHDFIVDISLDDCKKIKYRFDDCTITTANKRTGAPISTEDKNEKGESLHFHIEAYREKKTDVRIFSVIAEEKLLEKKRHHERILTSINQHNILAMKQSNQNPSSFFSRIDTQGTYSAQVEKYRKIEAGVLKAINNLESIIIDIRDLEKQYKVKPNDFQFIVEDIAKVNTKDNIDNPLNNLSTETEKIRKEMEYFKTKNKELEDFIRNFVAENNKRPKNANN